MADVSTTTLNFVAQTGKLYGAYTHGRPDGTVFYVGKGLERRSQCFNRPHNPVYMRIVRKYGKENIRVAFIPCKSEQHAFSAEELLISLLREGGVALVNQTSGGEGTSNLDPTMLHKRNLAIRLALSQPAVRVKLSAAARAAHSRPEVNEKHRAAAKLLMQNSEIRARISKKLRGRRLSLTHVAKIKAAINRPENLAKASALRKGKPLSADHRAKIAASHLGVKQSPERAAQTRAVQQRPDVKAKVSAASKKMHALRKAKALQSSLVTES